MPEEIWRVRPEAGQIAPVVTWSRCLAQGPVESNKETTKMSLITSFSK